MSQKLLNEAELILIETAMKSGDEYSDEDRVFNRLLSDIRKLREALKHKEWCSYPECDCSCGKRYEHFAIYREIAEGGKR